MAEGRKKNSKTGVLMSMNFGGINQSSATGTRPYVSDFLNPNIYKGLLPFGLIGTTYLTTNK